MGGSSDDNGNIAQPAGRTIRERDNVRQRAEEGHARLKVNAAFFLRTTGWWIPPTWDGSSMRLMRLQGSSAG